MAEPYKPRKALFEQFKDNSVRHGIGAQRSQKQSKVDTFWSRKDRDQQQAEFRLPVSIPQVKQVD